MAREEGGKDPEEQGLKGNKIRDVGESVAYPELGHQFFHDAVTFA